MRIKRGFEEAADINRELAKLKAKVEEIHDKSKALGEELSIEDLRERIKNNNSSFVKAKKTFSEYLEDYFSSSALVKGAGTMRAIKSTFNIIGEFAKDSGIKLDFKKYYSGFL